jgi:hypothetical protein
MEIPVEQFIVLRISSDQRQVTMHRDSGDHRVDASDSLANPQ